MAFRFRRLYDRVLELKKQGHDLGSRRRTIVFESPEIKEFIDSLPWKEKAKVLKLKDSNSTVRSLAVLTVGELGSKGSIPLIENMLKDRDSGVRMHAVQVLRDLGSKGSIPLIENRLKDHDSGVRMDAVRFLSEFGSSKRGILLIENMLNDPDSEVRRYAVQALVSLGSKRSIPLIEGVLKNSDNRMKEVVIWALGALGSEKSIPLIKNMLNNPDPGVKVSVVRALGALGSKKSIPLIKNMLNDHDPGVRVSAVWALGALGSKLSTELYQKHLLDPKFMDSTKRVVWRGQEKTGNRTILLGGMLRDKAVIKIMTQSQVEIWKRVMEAGVPVEPILKKRGGYRITKINKGPEKGKFRVSTGVLQGPSARIFFNHKENEKHVLQVKMQIENIHKKLNELGIIHGHENLGNFVVVMQNNRPIVYLIDFDLALSKVA